MNKFKSYRRIGITEMRPYEPGESMERVNISAVDKERGCPRVGDLIARKPDDHADLWLVSKKSFESLQFIEVDAAAELPITGSEADLVDARKVKQDLRHPSDRFRHPSDDH